MGALAGGTPPSYTPIPTPQAAPPTMAATAVNDAGTQARQRASAAAGAGMGGTVATSPQGLKTPASTAKQTLLGA